MVHTQQIQYPEISGLGGGPRWQIGAEAATRSLKDLAEGARTLVGAHHAVIRIAVDEAWSEVITVMATSDRYASLDLAPPATKGAEGLWCPVFRPMRMTQDELAVHPAWRVLRSGARKQPPLRGWLAVPLCDNQGRYLGAVELSDKIDGDFTADDERRLVEFARLVTPSVEDVRPGGERTPNIPGRQDYAVPAIHSEIGEILLRGGSLRDGLQACALVLAKRFDIPLVRIWTFQRDLLDLQASAGRYTHIDGAHARIVAGHNKIGLVAQTRQPIVSADLAAEPDIGDNNLIVRDKMQGFAGFPLIDDDELEGVIAVFDVKPLGSAVLQALTLLAHPLALFIKRQRTRLSPAPLPPGADPAVEHAVIVTDLSGAITDWNHGAEALFGYTRREALGQPIARLAPPERAREDGDLLQEAAQCHSAVLPCTQRLRKDGTAVDLCLTMAPMRGQAGTPVAAIFVAHDTAPMRRLQQQFLIAQKMEVFGHLTGGVAHDFNNLLTVILGYSEILMRRLGADESAHDLLAEIRKAGQRAETLTRQLLAFTRKKVVEPQVLDLNAVVNDSEKMLRRLVGEDILMTTVLDPCLMPVQVDPGQMQQVILNLAVNARDAMPEGGRLSIQTDNVALDEAYARSHNSRAGAYVRLTIADSGIGMSPAVQARIFEPLFTTKGPGKGTGLGLATVATIVKQAGGHIEVESDVSKGATFKLFLPQVQEAAPRSKAHSGLHAIPRGSETILLAEDEDTVRALARQVLEICGYRVLEAANGEEAARLFERRQGPIHMLISDVVMPYVGGQALAAQLRTADPNLKVLFLSGYTADAASRNGLGDVDCAYMQKPFTIRALAQKVRDILDTASIATS